MSSSNMGPFHFCIGIRSKLKLPRLRSSSVVEKDEQWSDQGDLGREKSDSNDSGKVRKKNEIF